MKYIGTKIVEARLCDSDEAKIKGYRIGNSKRGEPGYEVEYEDGYLSWSPMKVFEEAYRECSGMSFGLALEALKKGKKVQRKGWNGKGLMLELQRPDANSKMTLPYIYMVYPATPASDSAPTSHLNARVPWLASQTDMLSDDWAIVD